MLFSLFIVIKVISIDIFILIQIVLIALAEKHVLGKAQLTAVYLFTRCLSTAIIEFMVVFVLLIKDQHRVFNN